MERITISMNIVFINLGSYFLTWRISWWWDVQRRQIDAGGNRNVRLCKTKIMRNEKY